jgi:predicted DNA-binding transcriptional regulator AlpA
MAKVYREETYSADEVITMLKLHRQEAYEMLNKEEFPFPAIQVSPNSWRIPKKPVDDFLAGNLPRNYQPPWHKGRRGRPPKWKNGEYVHYNFHVPLDLHEVLNEVIEWENKKLPSPMPKGDWLRLALVEFVQRRPKPETTG